MSGDQGALSDLPAGLCVGEAPTSALAPCTPGVVANAVLAVAGGGCGGAPVLFRGGSMAGTSDAASPRSMRALTGIVTGGCGSTGFAFTLAREGSDAVLAAADTSCKGAVLS